MHSITKNLGSKNCFLSSYLTFFFICSLPSTLLLQGTSRLSGWRRRICSIGGFLCAPMQPPLPKSPPLPSPETCLTEATMTSTTSVQVKGQVVKADKWSVNMIKHDISAMCAMGLRCLWNDGVLCYTVFNPPNQQPQLLPISCFWGCLALIVCQQVYSPSSFVCNFVLWVPTRQWDRQERSLHAE